MHPLKSFIPSSTVVHTLKNHSWSFHLQKLHLIYSKRKLSKEYCCVASCSIQITCPCQLQLFFLHSTWSLPICHFCLGHWPWLQFLSCKVLSLFPIVSFSIHFQYFPMQYDSSDSFLSTWWVHVLSILCFLWISHVLGCWLQNCNCLDRSFLACIFRAWSLFFPYSPIWHFTWCPLLPQPSPLWGEKKKSSPYHCPWFPPISHIGAGLFSLFH